MIHPAGNPLEDYLLTPACYNLWLHICKSHFSFTHSRISLFSPGELKHMDAPGSSLNELSRLAFSNPLQWLSPEPGDENRENPRVKYGIDPSLSGASRRLTGPVTHSERGQPLFAAICARGGIE